MLEAFIQVDSEIESLPRNAALTDAEFDDMMMKSKPVKKTSDIEQMSFSELLDKSNQEKLYEINMLDLGRIPDEWALDESEVNTINNFVSAPHKKTFPANVEEMNFSESFSALNDNQSKLYL